LQVSVGVALACLAYAALCFLLMARLRNREGAEEAAEAGGEDGASGNKTPLRGDLVWLAYRAALQEEYELRAAAEREWRTRTEGGGAVWGARAVDLQAMDAGALELLDAQHAERLSAQQAA